MYPQVTQFETHTRLVQEHLERRRLRAASRRSQQVPSWWRRLLDRVSPGPNPPTDSARVGGAAS